ncbi:MAG: ankyrin repeat domain-containing protein [Candidatus Eisenbacteria bacterium]
MRRRRLPAVDVLLDAGAKIDARTSYGTTAWSHAMRRGFPEVAARLAERGADTGLSEAESLCVALIQARNDEAGAMLERDPQLVSKLDPETARIFPDLACRGLVDGMRLLLDAGVDITARGLDGGTALHQTGWFGVPAATALLIERGAPLDIKGDDHDGTPLAWTAHGSRYSGDAEARVQDYAAVAELLCAAGASMKDATRPSDPPGWQLLEDAVPAVAEVLRRYGARERS